MSIQAGTVRVANILSHLDTPVGIVVLYLGFGSGLAVFIFSGFVKAIPLERSKRVPIDGRGPIPDFLPDHHRRN